MGAVRVLPRFLREITATAAVRVVIRRLGSVAMLDATGARVLGEMVQEPRRQGITVLVQAPATSTGGCSPPQAPWRRSSSASTSSPPSPRRVPHAARHVPEAAPSGHPVYRLCTVPNERVSCELH